MAGNLRLTSLWISKPFKSNEKRFSFNVKSSFCSGDILRHLRLFGQVEKRLDKKTKVNFKILTSQTGQQIIAIHILPSILRNKSNRAMKFGQLIKHNVRYIFRWKSWRKWGKKTTSRPFFVFWKSFMEGCQHLSFNIFY